jgi:hypothetical protein
MTALRQIDIPGFTPHTLDAFNQLKSRAAPLARLRTGQLTVDARQGRDTLWIVVRRAGKGGIALKTARSAGEIRIAGRETEDGGAWTVDSESGRFDVKVRILSDTLMRLTVSLTPSNELLLPFWSRDLYPLDANDDPTRAKGLVQAAQRGVNTGLCYFELQKPAFGTVLYVQNLTALNDYFLATDTKPDGVVGGEWPELGYQPPTAPSGNSPPTKPLPRNQEVIISDALISFRDKVGLSEAESAAAFIDMLNDIYPYLDKPEVGHHDWYHRALRTLRSLKKSPECLIEQYGQSYLHPYTETEYPDSMVQLSIISPLRMFETAFGKTIDFAGELQAGMTRFYDKRLGTLRRYLPSVGKDKNKNAVDSWYLYHPLHNLGRLALAGDADARKLFLGSVDYGISAAQHFNYKWPVQYDVRNFAVINEGRKDSKLGQTDAGGLYAYVMLQAQQLTGEERFLAEAKAALHQLRGVRFELVYQTNLSAWGAAAAIRLWLKENDDAYLDTAHVFIAGFIHNCELWNSKIAHARHYPSFFGATCLHDAPYMSAYECYESFWAFEELLQEAGDKLPKPVRTLLLEYRRYTLDRAWYFYPDTLPGEVIERDKVRNGRVDRRLSIPVEDIYGDGQNAGQVGQEIYGAGGAFIFASRAMREIKGVPFRIYTDLPATIEPTQEGGVHARLLGPSGMTGKIVLMRKGSKDLPRIRARSQLSGKTVSPVRRTSTEAVYLSPASYPMTINWTANRAT